MTFIVCERKSTGQNGRQYHLNRLQGLRYGFNMAFVSRILTIIISMSIIDSRPIVYGGGGQSCAMGMHHKRRGGRPCYTFMWFRQGW